MQALQRVCARPNLAIRGFLGVSQCRALSRGASRGIKAGRAHQKGFDFGFEHARSFDQRQPVMQLVTPLHFCIHPMEAPMTQKELPLLGRLDAPSVVDPHLIKQCKTYRDAVKLCWRLRRVKYMTQAQLAAEAGLYAPHVSGYLHDGKHQRDLPGDRVKGFQSACGNTAIAQWHNMNMQLTCAEEMQLVLRAAA